MTKIFLILWIILPALAPSAPLDLKGSIDYALTHSPQLIERQQEWQRGQWEVQNALARMFPSVDLVLKLGPDDQSPRKKQSEWSSDFGLNLTENFYDNHESLNRWRQSQARLSKLEVQLLEMKNRLCRDVAELYLRWSLRQKGLEIAKAQFKLLEKQHSLLDRDYHQGLKSQRDLLRLKTQMARGQLDIVNAETELAASAQDLFSLMGWQESERSLENLRPYEMSAAEEKELKELQSLDYTLGEHFVAKMNARDLQAQKIEINLAQRKYWPEIALSGGLSYLTDSFIDTGKSPADNDRWAWNTFLTLKFNLWDWGIRRRNVQISKAQYAGVEARFNQALLDVKATVEKVILSIHRLQKNYQTAQELLRLEDNNLRTIEADYRMGKSSYLDLVTALQNLADAKLRNFNSLYELQIQYFNFLYHRGELYGRLFPSA